MRVLRTIALLGLATTFAAPAFSQTPRFRHLQGGKLEGVLFVDGSTGYVSGDSRIHRTEDGGATWLEVDLVNAETNEEIRVPLRGMFAVDADTILCCGDGGVILRSVPTFSGERWQDHNPTSRVLNANDDPARLYRIVMISSSTGWTCGDDGTLAKTTDGGETWTNYGPSISFDFEEGEDPRDVYDIHFFEDSGQGFDPFDKGIIASEYGRIYLTSNANEADPADIVWTEVNVRADAPTVCPSAGHNLELWSLAFEDPSDATTPIWVAGGVDTNHGFIFRSTGGGGENTWSQYNLYEFGSEDEEEKAEEVCGISTLYTVSVLDAGASPPRVGVNGYAGAVFEYKSGTANFDPCECSGTTGSTAPTWVQTDTTYPTPDLCSNRTPFFAGARISSTKLCVAGTFGRIGVYDAAAGSGAGVYTDFGSLAPTRLNDAAFVDASTGVIVGQGWTIRYTEDGGLTWPRATTGWDCSDPIGGQQAYSVAFASDGEHGIVVGTGGFIARTDNTSEPTEPWREWDRVTTENYQNLHAVAFVGASTGACSEPETAYAAGSSGFIIRSDDYGETWEYLGHNSPTSGDLHGVSFATPCLGYIVGVNGGVWITTDGGGTWSAVTVLGGSTETFYDVQTWGDGTQAILVGSNGSVFVKTSTRFEKVPEFAGSGPEFGFEVSEHLFDVEVLDAGATVRVGGTMGAVLFRDSGTWSRKRSGTTSEVQKLFFLSDDEGYAIATNFVVMKYDDP